MLARIDAWQRRHGRAAFLVGVCKKFGEDRASSHAALIAYYAFLSLFPLLLVFVSVLGFVLEDDPALQEDIVDSALARIPVIGAQLGDDVQPLTGSGVALAIGLAGALWAGLGVTLALGRAFDEIWDVPRLEQRGPVARRGARRARARHPRRARWWPPRSPAGWRSAARIGAGRRADRRHRRRAAGQRGRVPRRVLAADRPGPPTWPSCCPACCWRPPACSCCRRPAAGTSRT